MPLCEPDSVLEIHTGLALATFVRSWNCVSRWRFPSRVRETRARCSAWRLWTRTGSGATLRPRWRSNWRMGPSEAPCSGRCVVQIPRTAGNKLNEWEAQTVLAQSRSCALGPGMFLLLRRDISKLIPSFVSCLSRRLETTFVLLLENLRSFEQGCGLIVR